MSTEKKRVRQQFRDAVFRRDSHRCRACGASSADVRKDARTVVTGDTYLDAHHITDRTLMPAGGYVAENGISLCPGCHEKAEAFHDTGTSVEGYTPDDLYRMIGSSHAEALQASQRLNKSQ